MGYESALTAAGAVVHAFKKFGDYQGSWYAYVTYNGETGFTEGSYGSCSGCDAFEAEFGWRDENMTPEKLAKFGMSYLKDMLIPRDQLVERLQREVNDSYSYWGQEMKEALEWAKTVQ